VFAPAAVRKEIIGILHAAFVKALNSREVSAWLKDQGAIVVGNTPEQFENHIQAELTKWARVVKESGAVPD
jgi:tripartite-type tricarboxylate transporter receptor subunit TctC